MIAARWEDGKPRCPQCGSDNVIYLEKARLYKCRTAHPKQKFSLKVGTIFEDSPLGLDKWLTAIWLIANAKNGISSYEIHRALGVTQKSAWFMLHRIRLAMQQGSIEKLSGHVEVDETFIGGKARNMDESVLRERVKKVRCSAHWQESEHRQSCRHGPTGTKPAKCGLWLLRTSNASRCAKRSMLTLNQARWSTQTRSALTTISTTTFTM